MKCAHYVFGSLLQALYFEYGALTWINSKCQTVMVLSVTRSHPNMGERQMVANGDCRFQSTQCPPLRGSLEALALTGACCWPTQRCAEGTLLPGGGRLLEMEKPPPHEDCSFILKARVSEAEEPNARCLPTSCMPTPSRHHHTAIPAAVRPAMDSPPDSLPPLTRKKASVITYFSITVRKHND